jgi:hypothetical protein
MQQQPDGSYAVTVQLLSTAISGPRNLTVNAYDTSGGSGSDSITLYVP